MDTENNDINPVEDNDTIIFSNSDDNNVEAASNTTAKLPDPYVPIEDKDYSSAYIAGTASVPVPGPNTDGLDTADIPVFYQTRTMRLKYRLQELRPKLLLLAAGVAVLGGSFGVGYALGAPSEPVNNVPAVITPAPSTPAPPTVTPEPTETIAPSPSKTRTKPSPTETEDRDDDRKRKPPKDWDDWEDWLREHNE